MIVAFPGETEAQFRRTLDLIEAIGFDQVNTAAYSPRPGTPAADWPDQLPEAVKVARLREVNALVERVAAQRSARYLGRREQVLAEGPNPRDPSQLMGRTRTNRLTFFPADPGDGRPYAAGRSGGRDDRDRASVLPERPSPGPGPGSLIRLALFPASMAPAPTRVGLVFGGASGEHAVSILSARTVLGALRSGANAERYHVSCFYIDRWGRWWPQSRGRGRAGAGPACRSRRICPTRPQRGGFRGFPEGALEVEVWFPVLHGPNGEDGTIQGLFTLMGVPFVGSGVLGSALGMDKQAMKAAFAAAGLLQVPYACVGASELAGEGPDGDGAEALLVRLEGTIGYPCFVKPANMGSSVGISKATDRAGLRAGLELAASLDRRLVVERGVKARELECAVLQRPGGPGDGLCASVLGEIRFDADWYDYETKYSEGHSHTLIPAAVSEAVSERARTMALAACRAVDAGGLARVDFFYDEPDDTLWLNEINTLPGFTSQSMYPMLWEASGCPLPDLVHELVQGARGWGSRMNEEGRAA